MKYNLVAFPTANLSAQPCKAAASTCPAASTEAICLARDGILRLERSSRVCSIEVKSGVVWLTGTPAKGDAMLSAGEKFQLKDDWPFVIQSLEEAELVLNRNDAGRNHG